MVLAGTTLQQTASREKAWRGLDPTVETTWLTMMMMINNVKLLAVLFHNVRISFI